jgi:Ca2+-binding EF-hand superfamily protein
MKKTQSKEYKMLIEIGEKILEKYPNLRTAFQDWVEEGKKRINFSEFKYIINKKMSLQYKLDEIQKIFLLIDNKGVGYIDWENFQNAFSFEDKKSEHWVKI